MNRLPWRRSTIGI